MPKLTGIIDEPVKREEDDNLDISVHTKSLIRFIRQTNTPITIGIQGEWGSGKTSLINSIHHAFSNDASYKQIWINSWEYSLLSSPEEALLKIINKIINDILESDHDVERKTKIKEGAERLFKGALRIGVSAVAGGVDVAKELLGSSDQNISQLREQLGSLVEEIASRETNPIEKVLIYVDDLDRIEPKNAVAVLELLKNIFSIPYCVFILAIDYQVVVKGLESKFGKQTDDNEWEFKAFFDKIIQLPFKMPMGQYNIGKYVNHLLAEVGFLGEEGLDDQAISEVILRTIGGNPRSIKRLVNSVSLIQIFTEENKKFASNSENTQTENNEEKKMDSETEKILILALLCLQIAYPLIYRLLTKNPDFPSWNEALALAETKQKEVDKEGIFQKEFDLVTKSEDFDEPWEKALFRICYLQSRLKPLVADISKLFSYIKDELMKDNQENIGDSIEHALSQTSVTSIASTNEVEKSKKKFSVEGLAIKETVQFTFDNKKYVMKRFEGGAIRLYGEDKKEMVARQVFRKIIEDEQLASSLSINLKTANTRAIGPKLMKYFKEKTGG